MRRLWQGLTVVLVAAAVAAPSTAEAKTKPCRPHGAETLAATKRVRVYVRSSFEKGWDKLFACRVKDNTPITIATIFVDEEGYPFTTWNARMVRINGDFAAITVVDEFEDSHTDDYAVVVDTKKRKVGGQTAVKGKLGEITDLVLDAKGNIGYGTRVADIATPKLIAERRIDRYSSATGEGSLVASSLDIQLRTLTLTDGLLSWEQGAETLTAPIAAP